MVKLNLRNPNAFFTSVQNEFVFFTSRLKKRSEVSQNELSSKVERKGSQCHSFHLFKRPTMHASISDVSQSLNANVQMTSREGLTLQTERELFHSNCFVKN